MPVGFFAVDAHDFPAVGRLEKIVIAEAVETMMTDWTNGEFEWVDDAEHELLMEVPPIRNAFLDKVFTTFERASA